MKWVLAVVLGLTAALSAPAACVAETLSLPIQIDYRLLGSLAAASSFTEAGRSALVVDEADGCRQVRLSEPAFAEENGRIRFEVRVRVHSGFAVGSGCLLEVDWDGYLALFQEPVIDPGTWQLRFQTRDSRLLGPDRKPARLAGVVWDLIKHRVYTHLDRIAVDLSLPVEALISFIQPLVDPEGTALVRSTATGLRLGVVTVAPEAVFVPVRLELTEAVAAAGPPAGDADLGSEKRQRLLEVWQTWDEFLVSMITALAQRPLGDAERQVLFEVLLEARWGFVAALEAPAARKDFVRGQFVDAWRSLSPVFRAHLSEGATRSLLGYLAFFAAADALAALDKVGPSLGVEISREGLLRLIRRLDEGREAALDYGHEVNVPLRQTLGVGPPIDQGSAFLDRGGAPGGGERGAVLAGLRDGIRRLCQFAPARAAWAAEAETETETVPDRPELDDWIPPADGFDTYLPKVRRLIDGAIGKALAASDLNAYFHALCRRLAPAVAWQESCLRQFEIKDGQVSYLRSYNGTSVGIMQINERVWRGIYDREKLRWDIAYNARAGCEIITLYLQRFLLPRAGRQKPDLLLDEDLTARTLHAMYNGGPGEFSRFLDRHGARRYYQSDRLFHEKYRWVAAGAWDKLRNCWGG